MNPSEFTLIVPTKNEARNIPVLLASVPTFVPLILVDASEDETAEIALRLRPDRTQILKSKARIAEARNLGAELARTRWLIFSDADVTFAQDYFHQLAILPPCEAVYGPKFGTGDQAGYYRSFSKWQSRFDHLGIPAVSGSNFLIESNVFKMVGGFDTDLVVNEDTELGYRIKKKHYSIHFEPGLRVYAFDHRRIQRGATRKNIHTLTRCSLIYLNIFPSLWKTKDWGYWKAG